MVNTIALQTLNDGPKNAVIKVNITGDGSGDLTGTLVIDVSTLSGTIYGVPTRVSIQTVTANLSNFDAYLLWDADTDLLALDLSAGSSTTDFRPFGGLPNNAGTGVTGDVLIGTVGLGSGDRGTIIIEVDKTNFAVPTP